LAKMILIIPCPTTKTVSSPLFFSFLLFINNSADSRRLHTEHIRFLTGEKIIDAQQSRPWDGTSHPHPCPCVLVSCRRSFSSPQPAKATGLASLAPPTANEARTPCSGVRHTATCPALSYTPHLCTPIKAANMLRR
jgi:hypothetical protein